MEQLRRGRVCPMMSDGRIYLFPCEEEDMQIRFMHGVLGSGKTVFGSSVLVHVEASLQYCMVASWCVCIGVARCFDMTALLSFGCDVLLAHFRTTCTSMASTCCGKDPARRPSQQSLFVRTVPISDCFCGLHAEHYFGNF